MAMITFIVKYHFIHWGLNKMTAMAHNKTRTTRTPGFWDTPRRPMITNTTDSHQIPSQYKTMSKLHILKNCQKFKFWNIAKNFIRDIPSEWNRSNQNCRRYRADTGCGTDGQTDVRTEWNQYTPNKFVLRGAITIANTFQYRKMFVFC